MIAFDSTQAPHVDHPDTWKECALLERVTGADYLISPLSLPCKSEALIAKHLKANAVLVQLKVGGDLPASIEDGRLVESICRMHDFAARHGLILKPAQRILLPIGVFTGQEDDALLVNGYLHPAMTYHRFLGTMERWTEYGGTSPLIPLTRLDDFPWWCEMKERHLQELAETPVREFIVPAPEMFDTSNDPMQLPIKVKDGRRLLRTFLSESKTNALWDYARGNLVMALELVTDYRLLKDPHKPEGFGKGTIDHARRVLGLEPKYMLGRIRTDNE